MNTFIPQRAKDAHFLEIERLLVLYDHLYAMNKYDGVRIIVKDSVVYGKSMKPIPNSYIQKLYGIPEYEHLEAEIIVTVDGIIDPTTSCRETVSFINDLDKVSEHRLVLLDEYITGETTPFKERFKRVCDKYGKFTDTFLIPEYIVFTTVEELSAFESSLLERDHEGIIIRNPYLSYKEGTSTKLGHLLRIKRYISEELYVTGIESSMANNNVSFFNEVNRKTRSSYKENKTPKDEVGVIIGTTIKDIRDPHSNRLICKKGTEIKIAPGSMTKEERQFYFRNPDKLLGKLVKFLSFPKGTKDKPRFATFLTIVPDCDTPT